MIFLIMTESSIVNAYINACFDLGMMNDNKTMKHAFYHVFISFDPLFDTEINQNDYWIKNKGTQSAKKKQDFMCLLVRGYSIPYTVYERNSSVQ